MTKRRKRYVLPRKLSALLTLGLDDLREVERDPNYRVRMDCWHSREWRYRGTMGLVFDDCPCNVCLAGAVMAKTLDVSRYTDVWTPSFFADQDVVRAVRALEFARRGEARQALQQLTGRTRGRDFDRIPSRWDDGRAGHRLAPEYDEDGRGFYRVLRSMARDLRRAGL